MNESKKTLVFCGVAIVLAGTAWALYPKTDTTLVQSREGSLLFEGFTDPKSVTFLEIQKPAEQVKSLAEVIGKPERLTLTQQDGGNWVVASREDYPAGVMDRVAEAATALADLRIISVESEKAAESGDHERFGVIDPTSSNVDFATTGIGLRITAKAGDKPLADLIIGHPVQGQTDVRYVRRPHEDNVYTAKIKDFSRLTTRFDDWIETRVLDVNSSFDIRRVTIHDDTFALRDRAVQQRYKIDLAYDNEKSKWTPNRILKWNKEAKDYVPDDLKGDEELNTQTLNDLTFGLSDLKIVDVRRKDEEHAKAINRDTGELLISGIGQGEAIELGPGFFAMRNPNHPVAVLCAGGELQFATKEGMEYWVRFGGEAGLADKRDESAAMDDSKKEEAKKDDAKEDGDKKDAEKKDDEKKPDEKKTEDDTKVNRFMFVTVRFNEDLIDKPKLEQEPGDLPKDESAKKVDPADKEKEKDAPPADKPADKASEKSAEKASDKPAEKNEPSKSPASPDKTVPKPPQGDPKTAAPKPDTKSSSQSIAVPRVRLVNYQADEDKKTDSPKTDSPKTDSPKTDSPKTDSPKTDSSKADPLKTETKPAEKTPDKTAEKTDPASDKPAENKDAKNTDDAKKKADDEKKKAEDEKKKAEDEKKRIKEANDQKVKEYNETLEKGRKRAKDLNTRFADWFYVISEDSYKKLHLTRDDVVKKKEEKKDDDKKKKSTPPAFDPSKFNETLGD